MSLSDLLDEEAAAFGLALSSYQLQLFETYRLLLQDWGARMNLTAILAPEQIVIRHFLDSLTCSLATGDLSGRRLIDIGTGAGFPGLPLKILYPQLHLTLADSVVKKTQFLEAVVEALEMTEVTILPRRAEALGQDSQYRETYDWAVSRSVANLQTLSEYLLPLVRVGGNALAQKGAAYGEEVEAARGAITTLGGEVGPVKTVVIPGLEDRHALIVLNKTVNTDKKYPRRDGMPSKRPL